MSFSLAAVACGSDDEPTDDMPSSGGSGSGSGGGGSTVDVPLVCPLFTEDLATQLTDRTLVSAGIETENGDTRNCEYELEGTALLSLAYIAPSDGSPEDYESNCAGTVIEDVGPWACLIGGPDEGVLNTLATGNATFEVGVSGDTGDLEAYKTVARAMLAKLPE